MLRIHLALLQLTFKNVGPFSPCSVYEDGNLYCCGIKSVNNFKCYYNVLFTLPHSLEYYDPRVVCTQTETTCLS